MRKTFTKTALILLTLGAGACGDASSVDKEGPGVLLAPLKGAIFTTLADGTRVNANIYADKDDVYLDGGPGPGAPGMAACLPEGFYYFQVTDPSGMTPLSTDEIGCRRFEVTADCEIEYEPENCAMPHAVGMDLNDGGDTIALMPYLDTPNNGDEYKVWATPVDEYVEGGANFGFINSSSKTDNFKVRQAPPKCGDGELDEGEQCDDGNTVGGDGCSAICTIEPPCGNGMKDEGEECDDGNNVDGDGCSAICTIEPFCGDGTLDSGEQCDDGNNEDGDGCSADCAIESRCGDGTVNEGEQCDDGNTTGGDGCSATCEVEHGPKCGNGIPEEGEQCDDGNDNNEDQCTNDCKICDVIKPL